MSETETILLTIQETAEHLRLTRRSVERLIQAGQLPVVILGHKTRRIRRDDVIAFVDRKRAA